LWLGSPPLEVFSPQVHAPSFVRTWSPCQMNGNAKVSPKLPL
jgi:hypothetical protein